MKYIIILFIAAFFTVCHAEEWKPKIPAEMKVIRAECLQENPISEEIIEKMKNLELPNEEPVRKYILCKDKKTGLFDENQGYHADRVAAQFKLGMEEEEVLGVVNGCIDKNEQKSSVEEWAFRGHQCFMKSKLGDRVRVYIKKQREEAANKA